MTHHSQESGGSPERYRKYLLLLARQGLGPGLQSKLDPEDAVQEAMEQAFAKRRQFSGKTEGEYRGWLRSILVNTLKAQGRRFGTAGREAGRERSLEAAVEESSARLEAWLAADQSSPSQHVSREEELLGLAEAVAELPPDQQQAVVLKYMNGLGVEEIAAQMGRSKDAVGSLIYRGIQKLRKLLEDPSQDKP